MRQYTAYRSPIDLIRQLGLDVADINAVNLVAKKKELLLEIQLSEKQSIVLNEKEYTKNDVLQLFEEFSDSSELELHRKIAENEHLLRFLQSQTLPKYNAFVDNVYFDYDDQEGFASFKEMVSPYLAYAINRVMSRVLAQSDYKRMMLLEPLFELLQFVDFSFAFKKFVHFNTELQAEVLMQSPNEQHFDWEKYRHLDSSELYQLANFTDTGIPNFSQKLAVSIVNLTVHFQRAKGRKDYLVRLNEHALKLNCSEDVKTVIRDNRPKIKNSTERNLNRKRRRFAVRRSIILILGFVLLVYALSSLFSLVANSGSSNDSSFSSPRINEQKQGNDYDFYLPEFKEFHSHMVHAIANDSLVKFTGSEQPNFKSPFELFNKNFAVSPLHYISIANNTGDHLILVSSSILGLRSIHVPPYSRSQAGVSPFGTFFIYSGKDWKNDFGYGYNHYSETQGREFWMAFEGHFNTFETKNLTLLKQLYSVPPYGRRSILEIEETGSEFTLRYNDSYLKPKR